MARKNKVIIITKNTLIPRKDVRNIHTLGMNIVINKAFKFSYYTIKQLTEPESKIFKPEFRALSKTQLKNVLTTACVT